MALPNTYDIGDAVRCSITFAVSGTATDPTTVTARVKTPTGTINSYVYGVDSALVKDGIGTYHLDVYPNVAGTWAYRFEGTGAAWSATETTFNVRGSAFYS